MGLFGHGFLLDVMLVRNFFLRRQSIVAPVSFSRLPKDVTVSSSSPTAVRRRATRPARHCDAQRCLRIAPFGHPHRKLRGISVNATWPGSFRKTRSTELRCYALKKMGRACGIGFGRSAVAVPLQAKLRHCHAWCLLWALQLDPPHC